MLSSLNIVFKSPAKINIGSETSYLFQMTNRLKNTVIIFLDHNRQIIWKNSNTSIIASIW